MIEVDKHDIMKHFNRVCYRFLEEREAQLEKWGIHHHDHFKWLTILMEEIGEASEQALKMNLEQYEKEIIQCGAVIVAILEDLYDTFPNVFKQEERQLKNT